jgi:hypothetical protein
MIAIFKTFFIQKDAVDCSDTIIIHLCIRAGYKYSI